MPAAMLDQDMSLGVRRDLIERRLGHALSPQQAGLLRRRSVREMAGPSARDMFGPSSARDGFKLGSRPDVPGLPRLGKVNRSRPGSEFRASAFRSPAVLEQSMLRTAAATEHLEAQMTISERNARRRQRINLAAMVLVPLLLYLLERT